MTGIRWVYVTCRNASEARNLARLALGKRLAACANMFPVSSMYWWGGKIERSREWALLFKTRSSLAGRLTAELEKAHSYKVPCIEVVEVSGTNGPCAAWLAAQTRPRR